MIKNNNLSGCKKYDIAIIGAGPAGIMAAISASSAAIVGNISICLLERNKFAAKKLLLTGNGRCNYTADIDNDGLLSAFGKKGRFFSEAFKGFSNHDLIAFFKTEGIEPEYEKSDENETLIKVFPKNKNASSVRQCLVEKLKGNSIHVIYGFRAEKVLKVKNSEENGENYPFEIQPYKSFGSDNHLAHIVKNNLEPDNAGIGNSSYSDPATDISGSGKDSIDNYVLNKEPFSVFARKVILATGGRTYPQTGSTGDGYVIAKNLGHSIKELMPYLVPVFSKDRDIALLAGVSVKEVCLKILSGKKVMAKSTGSILFTHSGLSGPCAVSIGHEVYKLLKNKYKKDLAGHGCNIFNEHNPSQNNDRIPAGEYEGSNQDFFVASIDLAPNLSFEGFRKEIFRIYKYNAKKELLTILNMVLTNVPERLLDLILIRSKVIKNLKIGNLSKVEMTGIYNIIKNLEFKIDSALHFDEAIVTEGGIPVKEINPKDLQSVLTWGLYFAGEIIELAGPEGGFNLQKAFGTGWLAGKSATISLD